jgi:(E)-4-hydroxy-3-methylbut-2-enyl-diphosphate synthase
MNSRFLSDVVMIGDLPLGGLHPIRIQSMTNTDTNDIRATVAQCMRLADAGCEMIRITAQGVREAENLALIRKELRKQGVALPLIADIHFNPKAAEVAAALVEKVRINPGNYSDLRTSAGVLSPKTYEEELERTAARLRPLLDICKHNGTAIRIGTNHGSLSSRIMDRYGDTPEGMAESALEFGRICRSEGFSNLVFSMKSSNIRVMVASTRLLVSRMLQEGMRFPIHLGVTEAGAGEDGIIKSAAGIGTLLEDGIGDTLRVSLTGSPESEIPAARAIAGRYQISRTEKKTASEFSGMPEPIQKRQTIAVSGIGGSHPVAVLHPEAGQISVVDENLARIARLAEPDLKAMRICEGSASAIRKQLQDNPRRADHPLILKNSYDNSDLLQFRVNAAIDFGSLLNEGLGEAICIDAPCFSHETVIQTAFSILQATRTRITRTEYISCPSCGRTLFDIETVLHQVKEATAHLKGLKIAVMGCIVNGPGEMADADFGYVGAGPGKVTLYKGREIAEKNIPQEEALPKLLKLIGQGTDQKLR